jgi:hypothetical protein
MFLVKMRGLGVSGIWAVAIPAETIQKANVINFIVLESARPVTLSNKGLPMKALLCILFLSAIALAQTEDERKRDHDEHECKAHSIILESGTESLKLLPGFQENHSAFARGSDLYTHADAEYRAPFINFYKSRGTQAAPTPLLYTGYELDSMGGINFGGWDGSGYFQSAAFLANSDENWTPIAHGGHLSIYATVSGHVAGHQVAQFGGKDPQGNDADNIIAYEPLVFFGNQPGYPGLFPQAGNPPVLRARTGDNRRDAGLSAGSLIVTTPHTPATAFDACVAGTVAWDANFVYICVAPNTWRRSALSAW